MADENALSVEDTHAKETEDFAILGADGKRVEPEAEGQADPKGDETVAGKKAKSANPSPDDKATADDDTSAEDDIPDWLKKRVERANKKEEEADRRVAAAEKKADEAASALALLRAEFEEDKAARESGAAPKGKPDPDDYDTIAEYEAAKRSWEKAKDKPAKKADDKPKKDEAKPVDQSFPIGMTADDYAKAEGAVVGGFSKPTLDGLRKLSAFPVGMIAAVYDVSDGEAGTIDQVGKFILENPKVYEGILNTPERSWNKNLDRAFTEWQQRDQLEEKRRDVKQPEVIERSKGAAIPVIGGDDYRDFEKRRNEEEREGL